MRPGVNGWLVAAGRSGGAGGRDQRCASAIRRGSTRYGIAGRAIVEREFSWEAAGKATLQLYEELLA